MAARTKNSSALDGAWLLVPHAEEEYRALLCVAHHVDMATLHGDYVVTYPEDLAAVMGCTQATAARYLNELKGHGLVTGAAQAGYRLIDRLDGGTLITGVRKLA